MKAIKDPAETRRIEGYKKPELTVAELLIKYDNSLKELARCQCGSNSECYEDMKTEIKLIFSSGIEIERIEELIKLAIDKKKPDVFEAELFRIDFEIQTAIQKRCAMMSDYMAYEGPEEDDTRQPRPDEPEEYWIFEKILNERKRQDKKWGKQNHHPLYWLAILTEEIGEANKEIVEYINSNEIDKFRLQYYEIELIHSAAVIFAAINSLRRNELKEEVK